MRDLDDKNESELDEDKLDENEIIMRYKKIEKIDTTIMALSVTLLPIFFVYFNFYMDSKTQIVRTFVQGLGVLLILTLVGFYGFIRRCPNCRRMLDRNVVLPRSCPYCFVRFK